MNKYKTVKLTRELLEEETQLNEVFSPSMPKWLKDALLVTALPTMTSFDKRAQRRKYLRNKGVNIYIQGGDLITELLDLANIDINKARFISGEVPQSARDDRLKEPYLPIFLLEDDSDGIAVVAKGVNDEIRLPGGKEQVKYSSVKKVLEKCKAFCYVDTSDPRNFLTDKRSERAATKAELSRIPNYYRASPEDAIFSRKKYDKNGYVIDPDKYRNMLSKMKRNDVQGTLDNLYNKINAIKEKILKTYSDIDLRKFGNHERETDASRLLDLNALEILRNVCASYNKLCREVEHALTLTDEDEKNKLLDTLLVSTADRDAYARAVENDIKQLERRLQQAYSTKINWR